MDEPFYKASRAMLARTDLTLAEKLVRIVRAHWLAFEGREPTAAETARATGLSERQIYRILARKKGAFNAEDAEAAEKAKAGLGEKRRGRLTGCQAKPLTGCHDKMSVKTDKMSVPGPDACSKSYGVMRDVDKERGMITAPSPSAARGQKKEETDGLAEAAAKAGEQGGMFAMLALKGRAGGGKWPLARWIGQAEEDEAARRFSRADLEAFVASRTAITEAPWKLAEAVRRHAEAAKAAAFRERLRTIRGLTRVEPVLGPNDRRQAPGLDLRYRVRWADDGLLVIETEWRVGEKWIGGGLAERYEIRSLANAARWRFRAAQPTLF